MLSSPRHILLIGFFGDFFWEKPSSSRPSVSIRLRRPRARDERCAKHRLVEYFLDSCLGSRLFVRSRRFFMACPWIPLEEMEVVRSHPNRENLTSRTCCVWGNTVVPEHTPPRARPFHSQTVQTQASPFHLSRGVIRSITLFFWVGHLFQPFFIIVWCLDYLFCRFPGPNQSFVTGTGGILTKLFHCHRVPDAFQLPLCWIRGSSSSRSIGLSELHWYLFDIGRVFLEETGMGRFSWALQDPARNHPPWVVWNHMGFPSCIPVFCLLL